jgi:hypothetical protein
LVPRVLPSLLVAVSLAHAALASAAWASPPQDAPAVEPATLDVPYVPQSEALCGGAAAAMVFRYWGDAHAGVEPFEPLVDKRAGGIADGVLIHAIAERGWTTTRIAGSIDTLRDQIAQKHPVVILLQDRPTRYHYLVVVGVEPSAIIVHDPSWGPSRRIPIADALRLWRPARFWALVVTPPADRAPAPTAVSAAPTAPQTLSRCDVMLDGAISRVRELGFAAADDAFGAVNRACPDAAGPLRELAGVRFGQRRWQDAAALAARAVTLDPTDAYAWEVLASSRFVQDDLPGALRAWNAIGLPHLDAVDIHGLHHSRYELIADVLGLTPNTILTAAAFERAARRLGELPDRASARLAFRPAQDGFATVDVAIAERDVQPHGPFEWGAAAAKAIVNREIDVGVPGFTGQGELWSANWRWWTHRPRVAVGFAAPRTERLAGVWSVEASWESQRYVIDQDTRAFVDETRAHGGVSVGDWLTGDLRYRVAGGFDAWNGAQRTASIGAELEQRFARDRIGVAAVATAYAPVSAGAAFQSVSVHVDARRPSAAVRWGLAAAAGANAVSAAAPFALWSGAGDGHGRPVLLRAHPLLEDGAIAGPAFGRTLTYATAEIDRWMASASPVRVAIAAFTDVARATDRVPGAIGADWQMDAGIGLRVRVPGSPGTLRVDVGHGLRDGAHAFTVGWQY